MVPAKKAGTTWLVILSTLPLQLRTVRQEDCISLRAGRAKPERLHPPALIAQVRVVPCHMDEIGIALEVLLETQDLHTGTTRPGHNCTHEPANTCNLYVK